MHTRMGCTNVRPDTEDHFLNSNIIFNTEIHVVVQISKNVVRNGKQTLYILPYISSN